MRSFLLFLLGCNRGPDYGAYTAPIHDANAALELRPCDAVAMTRLVTALDAAGRSSDAVDRLAARRSACPMDEALERKEVEVAVHAARWADAEAIIGSRIEANPQDPANYTERSGVREKAGNASGAASDRRQAFLLAPKDEGSALDHARSLGKTPGDCAAWEAWGFVGWFHRDRRAEVDLQRGEIDPTKTCAGVAGKAARVKETLSPQRVFLLPGTIGDKPALFATDSALPVTLVSPAIAASAGMTPAPDSLLTRSGLGTSAGYPAAIPPIAFGGLTVTGLNGLVGETHLEGADVVLGIDFMMRVKLRRDADGRWDMVPRI